MRAALGGRVSPGRLILVLFLIWFYLYDGMLLKERNHWREVNLDPSPEPAPHQLCDPARVTLPLCALACSRDQYAAALFTHDYSDWRIPWTESMAPSNAVNVCLIPDQGEKKKSHMPRAI